MSVSCPVVTGVSDVVCLCAQVQVYRLETGQAEVCVGSSAGDFTCVSLGEQAAHLLTCGNKDRRYGGAAAAADTHTHKHTHKHTQRDTHTEANKEPFELDLVLPEGVLTGTL